VTNAAEHVNKAWVLYSLWRQYGTSHCAYRFYYKAARATGVLKRRFPALSWKEIATRGPGLGAARAWNEAYEKGRDALPPFLFPAGRLPEIPAAWGSSAVTEADDLLAGRMVYFHGRTAETGFPFAWLRNPFTGESADARRHWCDRDEFEAEQGDIRVLWEASRFGWAHVLVRAYAARKDERYARAFWNLVDSWRESNPLNRGPHWQCGQETGLRAMALCFALYGFAGSPESTPERRAALVLLLVQHGGRVEGNLHFARTQLGNHAVSEAAALYTLGTLLPWEKKAASWRDRGRAVLEDEARQHIRNDGSYVQHSMNYQRQMLQNYLFVVRLMQRGGERAAAELLERIDRTAEFLYQMQDPLSGKVPNYGPNDGSLVLRLNGCDFLDYRPVVQAAQAILHDRRRYPEGPWDEDTLWLKGEVPGPETLGAPLRFSRRFDDGGYYVLRGGEAWGMVRCHSFRNRPNHSDLLHLDLFWRGVNVLRDSGTYSYNAPEPWRNYFLSTAAHNTVEVGARDQMVKLGRFTWARLADARVRRFDAGLLRGADYFEGEHYGYLRLASRAVHRRAVMRLGDRAWLIVDDVLGRGREDVRLFWHLAEGHATLEGRRLRLETGKGSVAIEVVAEGDTALPVLEHGANGSGPAGWHSIHYFEKRPAPALSLRLQGPLPRRVVTLVALDEDLRLETERGLREARIVHQGVIQATLRLEPPGISGTGPMVELLKATPWLLAEARGSDAPAPPMKPRFRVEPLRQAHAVAMARVHLRAFPTSLRSRLGPGFLERFYAEFCRHAYDYGFVAFENGSDRMAAFVVGTSRARAHRQAFLLRRAPYLTWRVGERSLSDPEVRRLVRFALRGGPGRGASRPAGICPVRLLSIAVDPDFQGSGAAKAVADAFEAKLRAAGHRRVGLSVHADNARAIAFYEKTGWSVAHKSPAGWWFEKTLS
jgi:ribosomal protein S18 acetylase RimI-like enzyme